MNVPDLDLEQLYNDHFPILVDLATSKNVPREKAEALANDILYASLLRLGRIDNISNWLKGAMTSALRLRKGAA